MPGKKKIARNWVKSARLLRERLLEDPWRPRFHFAIPEDLGMPGDVNACFHANGRYHLMYLYERTGVGFSFGHMSSADLVHWRCHPDALSPGDGDEGCYSGGAFVDTDGTAYIAYWMLPGALGIGIAQAYGPNFEKWKKFPSNPVIKGTEYGLTETVDADGNPIALACADPSNIWKKNGQYYLCAGNLTVLNKHGRDGNSPIQYRGDHLTLYESEDLRSWTPKGDFYERKTDGRWTDESEDNMCPSFLPLPSSPHGGPPSDKHLLLFISHNRGCQYYVGRYNLSSDRFQPEEHGRMSWTDNAFFAPESLLDSKGRQIMWAWLFDNPSDHKSRGWSGVFALPRTLWLGDDNCLRMAPVPELQILRGNERQWRDLVLEDFENYRLEGVTGDACELEVEIGSCCSSAIKAGVKVLTSPDGEEETLIYHDSKKGELCFDTRKSGIDGRHVLEKAPLVLHEGEALNLRVFVDTSVVEVFANDRQAICRRVYPGRRDSLGIFLIAEGGRVQFSQVKAWDISPSNMF